jgi:predicted N-acetyltransferase YhbS
VLVAVDGGALVGSLILRHWSRLESSRHVAEVNGLAVDPERQGEGIGGRLLDAAIRPSARAGQSPPRPPRPLTR